MDKYLIPKDREGIMAYFGVTLGSGMRIIVDATSPDGARGLARRNHPGEEIVEAIYLTLLADEVWLSTL